MKVLITGASGMVGSHFVENYKGNITILTPSKEELDIINEKSVKDFFRLHKPGAILHFAAFTNVSMAEKQRNNKNTSCWVVNVEGTLNLVRASGLNTYFIHISTDNVFSGLEENPGPYSEDHPVEENPDLVSWYGWTKREAENIVKTNLANFAILRISNPVRAKYYLKLDYVRKILKLFDAGKLYPMFDDQYLTLTYINEVTESLRVLLKERLPGIYHVSSTNLFTPYKLASFLLEKARDRVGVVKPISIEGFLNTNPSRYPQYSGLKVEKTQKRLNLHFMSWEKIIISMIKQLST